MLFGPSQWATTVSCKFYKLLGYTQESNLMPLSPKESALPNELVCKLVGFGHETNFDRVKGYKKWLLRWRASQ